MSPPSCRPQLPDLPVGPSAPHVPASSESSVAQPMSARRRHRLSSTTDATSSGPGKDFPAKKNTRGPCRQLATSKVTRVNNSRINIRYDERHRAAPTADQHSSLAHDVGAVVRTYCPMKWKSWKVMPDAVHNEMNYNLENVNDELLGYINRLFADRYKQWKSDLHHHFQAFDDPQAALQEGCPKELEGREDSWQWLCGHFQEADYVKMAKANKGNREKKTLLHHSGSRPFSYRFRRGPNSQRLTSSATFMFDLGMSWRSPFIPIRRSSLWLLHRMRGGWGMPGGGNLDPVHRRSQIVF
ncbi:hypothetical protein ACE6H2_011515 [Prunus campanulata]